MEDTIVTVFQSIAFGSFIFAVVIGLGKKYHDEDQKAKHNSLSKNEM